MPTPPSLPATADRGLAWLERHGQTLLDLLGKAVDDDPEQLRSYARYEADWSRGDLFRKIWLRGATLSVLNGER